MRLSNTRLLETGWRMVGRALEAFESSEDLLALAGSPDRLGDLGLILGGDVILLQERMAIASTHMPRVQTDESTMALSFATAMVEDHAAKGSGWSVGRRLAGFDGGSAAEAARNAISSLNGQRVPGGSYRVILGPQPLAEILEWVLLPGLHLDMFHAGAPPFMGRFGQQVASEMLTLYDDGAAPGLAGSKSITDEGLPTGRTDLIKHGLLSGALSDYYGYQRMLHDPRGRKKLGVEPAGALGIGPRNGFRPGNGGGRDFGSPPSSTPTNLILEGPDRSRHEDLLRMVGDGIYIGRIWYTYPVNGITAGDFSGTIVGDSYIIKGGRRAAPLKPNTLRMNDNVIRVINNILGIGSDRRGTVRWSSDQVTWAPEVAVAGFQLEEISGYADTWKVFTSTGPETITTRGP
jgi:PmbA protein